jgi:hypothetical protein
MKKRKAFLFGFLMLAMITLLSGMVQAEKFVVKATNIEVSIKSPPDMLPTLNFTVNLQTQASTWFCTLNPGYQHGASVTVSDGILFTDMLDMQCYIYYIVNKPEMNLPTLTGYLRSIEKYPFRALNKAPKRFLAFNQASQSVPSWVYRQPRDGLRQSWQS